MAHHGAFEYDMTTVKRYEGIVVEHRWKNPHSLIVLDTNTESGEPIRLVIEAGGPSGLRPVGVTASSIVAGERVIAVVSPSKRYPDRSAYGHEIVKADGSTIPLDRRSAYARTPRVDSSASSIFGTWSPPWRAFIGLVNARTSWTFTDEGQIAFESYSPTQSSQADCVSVSAPWLMVHPVIHQIEKFEDFIVIRTDWLGGVERKVFLDDRPHPPSTEQFEQGHSVGRWEHDDLIIDTTNFADRIYAGVASSSEKHLVERFSLSEDGKKLDYSFVLDDPGYLVDSVSESFQWEFQPDLEPSEIACDLEIARRYIQEIE